MYVRHDELISENALYWGLLHELVLSMAMQHLQGYCILAELQAAVHPQQVRAQQQVHSIQSLKAVSKKQFYSVCYRLQVFYVWSTLKAL